MTLFDTLDILGTIAFAISGALSAMNRRFDLFGIFIIAFVTAIGGGTLRDVLISATPVSWMQNTVNLYLIGGVTMLSIIFRNKLNYLKKSLFLFDTIGLGIFTIIGVETGIQTNLAPIISIALGAMTGCFGGVIRDILCNEIPVIFRKEIYATASIAGGICFMILYTLNTPINLTYIITTLLIIIIRLIVVKYQVALPMFTVKNHKS
ncbi:trimeric intracellular cation channel family protein [Aquimarina sp. AD1]|uniref:trimeric intracellular cation channel family protein n=1 Tax=Aquimarina sp. (strain AD1) TaxID=1714848 RepID=UPI000E4D483A|nr:trimeric intracellular cation channel family protein [Aquimarina sp. AD1]AXT54200.1 trimeric intracellular cation channel family protein [Aquimarina sp. AD1]RKN28251.1 trimeric intracellular cation channel family protein [Aquimarina sp. AD1]